MLSNVLLRETYELAKLFYSNKVVWVFIEVKVDLCQHTTGSGDLLWQFRHIRSRGLEKYNAVVSGPHKMEEARRVLQVLKTEME